MTSRESERLPLSAKLGYGAASGAVGMIFSLFSLYFLFFLTDVVKLDPAFAGFAIMVGKLLEACLNPAVSFFGSVS